MLQTKPNNCVILARARIRHIRERQAAPVANQQRLSSIPPIGAIVQFVGFKRGYVSVKDCLEEKIGIVRALDDSDPQFLRAGIESEDVPHLRWLWVGALFSVGSP